MAGTGFLDRIYDQDEAGAAALYERWAPGYDAELTGAGYATPARVAAILRDAGADRAAPLLDFGCGTGLSGLALREAGFATLDGWDTGAAMLAEARAKGCYRHLTQLDPAADLPDCRYAAIAAVGVIVPSHAPPATLGALFARLAPGGLFAWSFNPLAMADPDYAAAADALAARAGATLLAAQDGVHIADRDSRSTVYLLRRDG